VARLIQKPFFSHPAVRSITLSGASERARQRARHQNHVKRQTDDRYRALFNSVDAGFCIIEMEFDGSGSPIDYRFIEVNDAFVSQTGLHNATGMWMRTLAPNHEQHWFDIYGKVALTGEAVRFENRADALDHRWYDVHAFRIGPGEQHQVGILFNDITARKNAELQQQTLISELGHRMKNTMAMVQAIATQTLRGASERDAVKVFSDRLQALSRAHDLLLKQNWASANLTQVIHAAAYAHAERVRFKLSGPELRLNPNAALSLTLLLHELATNAVKYGALSASEGVIEVIWSHDGAVLVLSWIESGGPPVLEPNRSGFGTRLIDEGIVGTKDVKKSYSTRGFRAEFRVPLNLIQSET
jgi:PAS domain S-box-containing protein